MLWFWLACQAQIEKPSDSGSDNSEGIPIVFISDTHIIGPQYECCSESDGIDNDSIMKTPDRLRQVVEQILMLDPAPEAIFMAGDVVHGAYFSNDFDTYRTVENAFSVASEILEPLPMPVYPAFGNHDYHYRCNGDGHSKDLSHQIFAHFFGVEPYYAVDFEGWKVIVLNSQLGSSWDASSPDCDTGVGSYGEVQLRWLDQELSEGVPSLVLSHHMLSITRKNEVNEPHFEDLETILTRHSDTVKGFFVGHTHRWLDFSDAYPFSHTVLGATRYDNDNFWLFELNQHTDQYEILDRAKVKWFTPCADSWIYQGMLDYDSILDGLPYAQANEPEETGDCE
ncbi:MAG: metallophosphoesterase [Myxococcota bacterium]|nr:metallophosphoesterase [Myxococcota bacterium]